MNCKPALEQLREPDALAVCGGATRQHRASAKPLTLMDGDPSCGCFGMFFDAQIGESSTKNVLLIISAFIRNARRKDFTVLACC